MTKTKHPGNLSTNKWSSKELENIPPEWNGAKLAESPGLVGSVRVGVDGAASVDFRYCMKWQGKVAWYYCGSYPKNSMPEIRDARDEAKKALKNGIDPRVNKAATRIAAQEEVDAVLARDAKRRADNLTVNDMFDDWLKMKGINRKDGNKSIKQAFQKHILPSIGDVGVRLLDERHLTKIYEQIVADNKPTTAFELSKDVKQMLKWAEKRKPWRQLMVDGNPADLVEIAHILPAGFTKIRKRVLSVSEIVALNAKFEELESNYASAAHKYGAERSIKKEVQIALWLSLSCLTRIGETLKAEWKHVDFKSRTWFIPKENTKKSGKKDTRTDHIIYLSDFAIVKLEKLLALTGDTRWLFPARYTESHVCEKSASKLIGDRQIAFKNRTKKLSCRVENNSLVLGEEKWSPHDMRRSGATMMQELGVDREIINLCQHHKIGSAVDQHYLKHQYEDRQLEAWKKLGNRLDAILKSKNVVPMKSRVA